MSDEPQVHEVFGAYCGGTLAVLATMLICRIGEVPFWRCCFACLVAALCAHVLTYAVLERL